MDVQLRVKERGIYGVFVHGSIKFGSYPVSMNWYSLYAC